ncbi:transporter substrate-binding domain-containing protein [Methanolacinia petrolearia]|uniref:transporter substrate-binding domain-containing protein n=1 Tax=Methanolacinia petrolearia TaxID=54120 RepID=UPI003BACE485
MDPRLSTAFRRLVGSLLILVIILNLIISPGYAAYSEDQVLVVGADEYFPPPNEYIDYNGQPAGFNIDIMNAVAEEMSLNISIRPGPWYEVRSDLESGRIDFISGMFYSGERDLLVNFSEPYISVSHTIFVREGSDIGGAGDLTGKEIVVEEGDIMHDYVMGLDGSNTIITTHNQSEALLLLASGKYDAALLSKLHGDYLIMQYGLSGVKTAGPPIEIREYCVAASANASCLLPVINEGLVIIRKNGKYDEIYKKWFGTLEEREFFLTLVNIVIFRLLPVIVLLAIALIWSVSLRKKLIKTSSELRNEHFQQEIVKTALQESKDKYRVLFNSLNEGVFLCEYDPEKNSGRIIEVNDTACRRLGYTREEMIDKNVFEFTRLLSSGCEELNEKLSGDKNEVSYYAEHVRKDGSVFPVHVKARLLSYGGREYVLQLARGITKERESDEREAEALKK